MNTQKTLLALINRDLNKEYLSEKMLLLLDDMLLVMRAYDKLIEWGYNSMEAIQSYNKDQCMVAAANITEDRNDTIPYGYPWWIKKEEFHLRFRGIWFTFNHTEDYDVLQKENSDMIRIAHCCFLRTMLTKVFEKHYAWKEKIYVTLDFLYFTFQSGTFFKFPAYKQKPPAVTDCGKGLAIGKTAAYYDPRCRPYYKQAEEAVGKRITITQPYKFISGAYGNDICIKSKEFQSSQEEADKEPWNMNRFLFCAAFNFFDYYLLKTQIGTILEKTETMLYLIYFNHVDNTIKVLFNSLYYPNDLTCESIQGLTCEAINLFNVYYKKVLDEIKVLKLPPKDYITMYNNLEEDFKDKIMKHLINIVKSNNTELLSITIDNLTEEMIPKFSFTTNRNMELVNGELVENAAKDNVFYVFPLMGGFDLNGDDYEIIEDNSVYNYYIVTNERGNSFDQSAVNFKYIISIEVFLFLFYLIILNGLIWVGFSVLSYYIIQGFVAPLGNVRKLYIDVGRKMDNDKNNYSKGKELCKIKPKESSSGSSITNSIFEKVMSFDDIIISKLVSIFKSDQYEEVKDSLTTLKAFNLIIDSKAKSKTLTELTNQTNSITLIANNLNKPSPINISSFFEAIIFLYNCFYTNLLGKQCDHKILCLLINNIFSNLLQDYHTIPPEKQRLSNAHINHFYEKNIIRVIQIAKKQIKDDNASKKITMEYALDALDKIAEVEENIVYRYSTHNSTILDQRILLEEYDKHKFNPFDDEQAENVKLKTIERIEKMQGKQKEKEREKERRKMDYWRRHNDEKKEIEYYNNESNVDEIDSLIRNINIYLELHNKHAVVKEMQLGNYNEYLETKAAIEGMNKKEDNIDEEEEELIDHDKSLKAVLSPYDLKHNPIIEEFYEILEELTALVILSKYHLIKNDKSKGLNIAKEAFNKLSELEKLINHYKRHSTSLKDNETINEVNWSKTNFILVTLNIFFFEKVFFSFGLFYESHHQLKSALFVYTNILDLGPFYSISIRRMILIKLLNILKKFQSNLLLPINSMEDFKMNLNEQDYINQNLMRMKLATILNVTSKDVHKQITFLFDYNNKFVKNKLIKTIIQRFKEKEILRNRRIMMNFCGFDYMFYIVNDYNKSEKYKGDKMIIVPEVHENKSIIVGNSRHDTINQSKKENDTEMEAETIEKGDMENDSSIDTFFQFFDIKEKKGKGINDKKSCLNVVNKSKGKHRADYALHNTIIHSFKDWNTIVNPEMKQKIIIPPSTLNNYLLMMINLDAEFNEKREEMKELGKLLFDKKITLIIIITYDKAMEYSPAKKHKIDVYKNFLRNYVNDGHLFIMRSLSMLKFIFNTIFPIPFSEFNSDLLYQYIKNVEQIKRNYTMKTEPY